MREDVAREHLEPLTTWCRIAVATHVLALAAASDADAASLMLRFVIAVAALILPWESDARPAGSVPSARRLHPPTDAERPHVPVASLWTDSVEAQMCRKGLWGPGWHPFATRSPAATTGGP